MKLFYSLVFFFVCAITLAQTTVSGLVVNQRGEPVTGANIILRDTYDGTTTDANGLFEFITSETGDHFLVITFIGYDERVQALNLTGAPVVLQLKMQEAARALDAVTITAGALTASDESRRTVLRAIDIATTAGATADIAGALNTLPGTQKVGETGRLFVRGGDSYEARTFIDGMLVLNAYNPSAPNTPSRGRFLPFMFKGTSFSTGGYSAEYGQALSSVLVLDSKDEAEITRTDFGILSVGGDVAHTQAWKGGSAAGKVQYTNLRPYMGVINQEIDWITPPVSLEGIAALRQQVGKGMIKAYANFNRASFTLYEHLLGNVDKFRYALDNDYRYANASYRGVAGERWALMGGAAYTFVQNDAHLGDDDVLDREEGLHVKTVLEGSLSDHASLKTGIELLHRTYQQTFQPSAGTGGRRALEENIAAAFAEADVFVGASFVARMGGRAEHNALTGQRSIDPRASLAYRTGDYSQVSVAYGIFRQSASNEYVSVEKTLAQEKANHYILNYQYSADKRTFRVEAYYKRYSDLVKFDGFHMASLRNGGRGYAKGIELFWRDNGSLRNVDYWISYSLLDTRRDYLNFPGAAVPTFASRHNFSGVYKHFVQAINSQLGFTYSYASARPYNDPNSDAFNAGRTPHYSDLSFNWSYLPAPSVIIYFSCTNLLGRDNVFGYTYSDTPGDDGIYQSRPVRQAAPRFLFAGVFITLSKDKSVNQLPSL